MVQKGGKEGADELNNDLKEEHNINHESINSTLNFSNIYLDHDGDKAEPMMSQSSNYLAVDDNDDLWNRSDNASQANSNCSSSNSSTSGNLMRNINLDECEFELKQTNNKEDLVIRVRLKKIKFNNIRLVTEHMHLGKTISLELEDYNKASYSLKLRPLYDSIKEILSINQIDKDCFEITCVKEIAINWPSLIEEKLALSNYRMKNFCVPFKQEIQEDDSDLRNAYSKEEIADKNSPFYRFPSNNWEFQQRNAIASWSNHNSADLQEDENLQNYNQYMSSRRIDIRYNHTRDSWREITDNSPQSSSLNTTQLNNQIGYTGLDNLGNTCFMNAVLQCLSNTDELRDYFLDNNFNSCINRTNPFGAKGCIAIGFYNLLKHLWSGDHVSYSPENFKNYISTKMNKFEGNSQKDSVEFLELFLDLLHEDLNRRDRTKTIIVDPLPKPEDEMTDNELANAMWKRHLKYNDSLIVDFFHGQLKSHLICTVCKKNSITFDPFLFLPVPLPKPQITYTVFYFSLDYSKKPLKVSVTSNQDVKCVTLLQSISEKFKVKISNLRMLAYYKSRDKTIEPDEQINHYENSDLFIFQVKDEEECKEKVFNFLIKQFRLSTSKSYLDFETCDSEYWSLNDWIPERQSFCKPTQYNPLGRPFIISLTKSELNFKNLCSVLKNRSRHSVDINVFELNIEENNSKKAAGDANNQVPASSAGNSLENLDASSGESLEDPMMLNDSTIEIKVKPFKLANRVVRSVRKVETLSETNLDHSFNILKIDNGDFVNTTVLNEQTDFESFAKRLSPSPSLEVLYMQWKDEPNSNYRLRVMCKDLDHSATYFELMNQINKNTTTLEDCLKMFTDKEELSLEDSWQCPACKKPQKASKQLTIWRLPKILIIQLKRFSYKQFTRDKIDNFIEFPLRNLDLKSFCSESNQANLEGETTYDLYGVINHFGGIYGGHYTATAKTVYKNEQYQWRLFDDYSVDNIDENLIVTSNTYILFYRLSKSNDTTKSQSNGSMEIS